MKHRTSIFTIFVSLVFLVVLSSSAFADTNVSGLIGSDTTWDQAGSPYIVTGGVLVDSGVTLTIDPGVQVKFNSGLSLQIDGTLIAQGTSGDKIIFTTNSLGNYWGYIFFSDSSTDATSDFDGNYTGGCILEYCVVEYAGGVIVSNNGAVRMDNAHPFINYCTIKNNQESGINAWDLSGNLIIKNNTICNNTSDGSGGGIRISGGGGSLYVNISGNSITSNDAAISGGGISFFFYDAILNLSNNTISNNHCSSGGGGIYYGTGRGTGVNNDIDMTNNLVSSNDANLGGGIYFYMYSGGDDVTASYNVIRNNTASGSGGGIYAYGEIAGDLVVIKNSIISNNATGSGGGICISRYSMPYTRSVSLSDNIIANNIALSPGGGIYFDDDSGDANLSNNTISSNTAPNGAAVRAGYITNFKYSTIVLNAATNPQSTYALSISSHPLFNYNNKRLLT